MQTPTAAETLEAQLYDWDVRQYLRRQLGDIAFYTRHARGHVLELACGTGRVTRGLLDAGHEVTAVDHHWGMLARAKARLPKRVQLLHGDMRTPDLANRFPTVVLSYNSLQLMLTREDQHACLTTAHRHLTDDGRLLLEVTPFLLRDPPSDWTLRAVDHLHADPRAAHDQTVVAAWERCRTQPAKQLSHFDTRYHLFAHGTRTEHQRTQTLRTILRDELVRLLESCGFGVERIDGDYQGTPLAEQHTDGMVVVARRLA